MSTQPNNATGSVKAWLKQLNQAIWASYEDTPVNAGAFDTKKGYFQICLFVAEFHLCLKLKALDEQQVKLYDFEGEWGLSQFAPLLLRRRGTYARAEILAAFTATRAGRKVKSTLGQTVTDYSQPTPADRKVGSSPRRRPFKPTTSDLAVFMFFSALSDLLQLGLIVISLLGLPVDQPQSWGILFLLCLALLLLGRFLEHLWERHKASSAEAADQGNSDKEI